MYICCSCSGSRSFSWASSNFWFCCSWWKPSNKSVLSVREHIPRKKNVFFLDWPWDLSFLLCANIIAKGANILQKTKQCSEKMEGWIGTYDPRRKKKHLHEKQKLKVHQIPILFPALNPHSNELHCLHCNHNTVQAYTQYTRIHNHSTAVSRL